MSKFIRYEACQRCREKGADTRGDNKALYSDGSTHCFSCGHHGFPKHYVRQNEEIRANDKKALPSDFSREIPVSAWKWLLQYGLGYKYWEKYCGYSEKDSRLIFTVGTPAEFSIGRFIERPGYASGGEEVRQEEGAVVQRVGASIDGVPRKWYVYGDSHKTAHIFGETETSKNIVLVEDIVSAHKVAQITNSIPLFGTNVFDGVINVLRLYKKPVIMWLDNDQKSKAHRRAARLAMLTGCPVSFVFTEEDPKSLSLNQIKDLVL